MGPEINEKMADIANNRWAEKQEKEIVNERVKQYKMSRNCENVVVPRVNDEIWLKLPSICKENDVKLASIEKCITASTAAVLECANDLLKAKKSKSRFDYNAMTDAVSLLGHVNHDLQCWEKAKSHKATLERGISALVHCKYSHREIIIWRRFSQRATQCKSEESLL